MHNKKTRASLVMGADPGGFTLATQGVAREPSLSVPRVRTPARDSRLQRYRLALGIADASNAVRSRVATSGEVQALAALADSREWMLSEPADCRLGEMCDGRAPECTSVREKEEKEMANDASEVPPSATAPAGNMQRYSAFAPEIGGKNCIVEVKSGGLEERRLAQQVTDRTAPDPAEPVREIKDGGLRHHTHRCNVNEGMRVSDAQSFLPQPLECGLTGDTRPLIDATAKSNRLGQARHASEL
ncbi:hypothetical protein B0H11DRAFT_1908179 [Mycena galericulata]|nr:hypothetical protein B0H11DRAFT_1908179 [Mycena galericulata]